MRGGEHLGSHVGEWRGLGSDSKGAGWGGEDVEEGTHLYENLTIGLRTGCTKKKETLQAGGLSARRT